MNRIRCLISISVASVLALSAFGQAPVIPKPDPDKVNPRPEGPPSKIHPRDDGDRVDHDGDHDRDRDDKAVSNGTKRVENPAAKIGDRDDHDRDRDRDHDGKAPTNQPPKEVVPSGK